jgi:putative ABC transport system ATP-binding protein
MSEARERVLVEVEDVRKIYGRGEAEVRALDGVTLSIEEGDFVAVMGPSGSGKSTFMNLLGCLDVPTSGKFYLRGVEIGALDKDALALLRRHQLGFVFQGFNLIARTTALENVELPLLYQGLPRAERRARAMESLRHVGLENRATHLPNELSGGQQQRVAIARALVTRPAIILADEPTGNLDSVKSEEIMRLLVSLNERSGITIAMVTHEPDMAAYARRTVSFKDGRVVADERRRPPSKNRGSLDEAAEKYEAEERERREREERAQSAEGAT